FGGGVSRVIRITAIEKQAKSAPCAARTSVASSPATTLIGFPINVRFQAVALLHSCSYRQIINRSCAAQRNENNRTGLTEAVRSVVRSWLFLLSPRPPMPAAHPDKWCKEEKHKREKRQKSRSVKK